MSNDKVYQMKCDTCGLKADVETFEGLPHLDNVRCILPGCTGKFIIDTADLFDSIRKWVKSNADILMHDTVLDPEDVNHIATCLEHLYRHFTEGYPIGDFLSAVADNNLAEAVVRADDVNRKALYLYVLFLANKIPYPWVLARRKSEKVLRVLQAAERAKGEVALSGEKGKGNTEHRLVQRLASELHEAERSRFMADNTEQSK